MPLAPVYTANRGYKLVRKALNASETWDWFAEYTSLWAQVDTDVQDLQDQIDTLSLSVTAENVTLQAKSGSTTQSVQDFINHNQGAGIISFGGVTDNLDGTVTVHESIFFASTASTRGSQKAYFTVSEKILTLTQGLTNFIVVDFAAALPFEFEIIFDPTNWQAREDRIIFELVFYEADGTVRLTGTEPGFVNFHSVYQERDYDFATGAGYFFAQRASGALLGDTGVRYVTLTSGSFWAALRRKQTPDFDTSGTDTMIRYYRDGGGGWTKQTGQTQLDNIYYDNGSGTLAAMNTGRFKCVNMYILFDGDGLIELEAQAQYTSLALAQEESRPTTVPDILNTFSIYLGRYIVQQGNDVVVVESSFLSDIAVGVVTAHTSLSNLNSDPHHQHYDSLAERLHPSNLKVENNEFGSDSIEIGFIEDPLLLTGETLVGYNPTTGYLTADSRYVYLIANSGEIIRLSRPDLTIIETSAAFASAGMLSVGGKLLLLSTDLIYEFNPEDLTDYASITATGINIAENLLYRETDGKLWTVDGANALQSAERLASTYSVTTGATLASMANLARHTCFSPDEATLFVFDSPATSGTAYVRAYNLSGTLLDTSAAITVTLGNLGTLYCDNEGLHLLVDGKHTLYDATDLTGILYSDTGVHGTGPGCVFDGVVYKTTLATNSTVLAYNLAGLSLKLPAHVDGSGVLSSNFIDEDGNIISHHDWSRIARQGFNKTLDNTEDITETATKVFVTPEAASFAEGARDGWSGFTRNDELDVAYDMVARTITVSVSSGTFDAYYDGVKVIDGATTWTSDAHTASPTGTLFLYYTTGGFTWSYTPWSFMDMMVAYVFVDSSNTPRFAQREVHGFMSWEAHREFHHTVGTYRRSGGDVAGYVLLSTTADDRRPTTSATVVYDEDIPSTVTAHTSKNNYARLYLSGPTGVADPDDSVADIVELSANQPYYNQWTGTLFQKTLMTNNSFMNVFQLAIPVTTDADSQLLRYIYVAGQTNGTISQARAEGVLDLNLGEIVLYYPEFVFIQKITIQYASGNWAWYETERLEGTRAQITSSPSGAWLSSVAHDDTLTGAGTAASPLALATDIPVGEGESYVYSDDAIAGSTDYAGVEFRDLTLLQTSPAATDPGGGFTEVNEKYVSISTNSNVLEIYDRKTLSLVNSVALGLGRNSFLPDGRIAVFTVGSIYVLNLPDLSTDFVKTSAYTGNVVSCISPQGTFFAYHDATGLLHEYETDGFTSTTLSLSGIESARGIAVDESLNKVFIIDDVSTPSYLGTLREFALDTGVAGSTYVLDTPNASNYYAQCYLSGGLLYVLHRNTGLTSTVSCTVFDPSDVSAAIFTGTANTQGIYSGVYDGIMYVRNSSAFIQAHQLPSLTQKMPYHLDCTQTPYSTIKSSEIDGIYSLTDFIRDHLDTLRLVDGQFGVTVASMETSLPGSPAANTMYLMSSVSTDYPNWLAYYDIVRGWLFYQPYNGATVFETERGIFHDYADSQWNPRVDTFIRGTVTIPASTSIGTWTSSRIQFNDGNPMMLNTDDMLMLECDYKLICRSDVNRSFLHRSNRIDIAPEYQLHSYADDVDHGEIIAATTASSYVNIEGETTPDKSGILFAEIVVELSVSPTFDIEIEYDIRLKGTLVLDAGTYDC